MIWFSFLKSKEIRMRLKILVGALSSEEHKKETGLEEEDGQWRTLVSGKVGKLGKMEGNGPLKAPGGRREIEEDSQS